MHCSSSMRSSNGMLMVSKQFATANNPRVDGYDPKSKSHILYLDSNNLYRWAMSQGLPTSGFGWVEDCLSLERIMAQHPADSQEGFILEVDLEYPEGLHNVHNTYLLAPECMVIQNVWMSEHQCNLICVGRVPTKVEKLVNNLRKKEC